MEKLLRLEIPPQAQWMRVMLTELTRLNSHLVWLGTHALDIGAMSVFLYCFREREDILRIFEMFSGQRMMTSYFRIGGLALEPPRGWHEARQEVHRRVPEQGRRVRRPADEQSASGCGRTQGRRLHFARRHARSGRDRPDAARRRAEDAMRARTSRIPATRSSISKCRRAPKTMCTRAIRCASKRCGRARGSSSRRWKACPTGRWQADAPHVVLPDREKMKTQMEALIYHFKIVTEGFRVPEGEVYQVIESPRGELGYYVVSDGTSKPYRVHMRTPSFGNLQALPTMVEGTLIADVIAAHRQHGFRAGRHGPVR